MTKRRSPKAKSREPDPVVTEIVRNGVIAAQGTTPANEDFIATLPAGDYVIDVHDCGLAGCGNVATGASDITVTIAPN